MVTHFYLILFPPFQVLDDNLAAFTLISLEWRRLNVVVEKQQRHLGTSALRRTIKQ